MNPETFLSNVTQVLFGISAIVFLIALTTMISFAVYRFTHEALKQIDKEACKFGLKKTQRIRTRKTEKPRTGKPMLAKSKRETVG
jgi:CDP-diacylglycerol pyrophosphatase